MRKWLQNLYTICIREVYVTYTFVFWILYLLILELWILKFKICNFVIFQFCDWSLLLLSTFCTFAIMHFWHCALLRLWFFSIEILLFCDFVIIVIFQFCYFAVLWIAVVQFVLYFVFISIYILLRSMGANTPKGIYKHNICYFSAPVNTDFYISMVFSLNIHC